MNNNEKANHFLTNYVTALIGAGAVGAGLGAAGGPIPFETHQSQKPSKDQRTTG